MKAVSGCLMRLSWMTFRPFRMGMYVHDDEIRIQRVDAGEGLHAVGGLAHHLAVVGVPVEKALEALPDDDLVVHQQDAELLHGSSFPSGSRMWAVMPPVSFSV